MPAFPSPKSKAQNGTRKTLSAEAAAIQSSILHYLKYKMGRDSESATPRDWWIATATAVRDRMIERGLETYKAHRQGNVRRVYYLSLEYLIGRLMLNNVINLGLHEAIGEALEDVGQNFDRIRAQEEDMGLGNGGLGRLAACYLDSLSTMDLPAVGYGIHYEFGLFRQEFVNGHQIEHPDNWLIYGAPWELVRPEFTQPVRLFGRCEQVFDDQGNFTWRWVDTKTILGFPYDIPVAGYGTTTVNILRLWASKATEDFDLKVFNEGGYIEAVREKAYGETISKVLYPNDKTETGRELRLVQQYFFVTCSLRDIIRRHFSNPVNGWDNFADKQCIQLNDTHPALAIVELLRILLDEEGMVFDRAWDIVTHVFAYTNHTLMPEALEKWSIPLFQRVLPRHLRLVFQVNDHLMRLCEEKWPGDHEKKRVVSLIEEGGAKAVRMANLSVVGSFAVNGVAELHTRLLRAHLFPEFDDLYPGKFVNVTNGITPRRWLRACNPRLSALITARIGDGWPRDLDQLKKLEKWADDPGFQDEFMAIKRQNKVDLSAIIKRECGVEVSPDALFDVQIKRLHEYKRQHLNLLHIVALYRRLVQNPQLDVVPRVFVFAAKAAPGYDLAKAIIKSINAVAAHVNNDPRVNGRLKIAFLPNYRVSLAARIIPAADLSEQISTAGKEASGTGNMKLALNGALTIGTLDGANVEIREEVGDDNIFIFGQTVEEVEALRAEGYSPRSHYEQDEELRAVLDWLGSDYFVKGEPTNLPAMVRASLLEGGDPFMVLADFRSYSDAQLKVDAAYRDKRRWAKMAILNTARVGKFSSDRSIRDYADKIWKLRRVAVD
ncbi:MAG: glycogen phosphorylase [Opitutus sp.]|nr:glycogen phosphorylase [Opitutus sp.]